MIGFGYDSHRFGGEKKLIIGGIEVDSPFGIIAHSDGDALLHALVDALLGAMGKGDIGELFPDSDKQFENMDSANFVEHALQLVKDGGYNIINIDATVLLEKPKLSIYKHSIRNNIAKLCEIESDKVNIKAKTNEKMGFTGRSEGIAVFCICQIEKS